MSADNGIYILKTKDQYRVAHFQNAEYMNYSKPSISRAVNLLKERGYIVIESNGNIYFTEKGKEYAEKIYSKHLVISQALMHLGVSEEVAVNDACKIEHVISDESFEAIKKHMHNR